MASAGLINILDAGKLSWPTLLDYESLVVQGNPELQQQRQNDLETQQMIEMFKNASN